MAVGIDETRHHYISLKIPLTDLGTGPLQQVFISSGICNPPILRKHGLHAWLLVLHGKDRSIVIQYLSHDALSLQII